MLDKAESLISNLEVDAARMRENLESAGELVFSEHAMLRLVRAGMKKKQAYGVVQRHALGGKPFRQSRSRGAALCRRRRDCRMLRPGAFAQACGRRARGPSRKSGICESTPGVYAPDVKKALSVVIDIDDVGEQEVRRQDVDRAWRSIKQQARAMGLQVFSCTFSVHEPGWTITFALDVHPGSCVLRLASRSDFEEVYGRRYRRLPTKPGADLPGLDQLTAEDLLCGVESFLLKDMLEE